ncbi:TPA: hypothetical protein N0F65_010235 [Lagenidium giganteum]|uniref:Uncharacterized protein n=1 Tax=Lagenidium giganteum TaxID=4803 RepID=A0AAV2YXQ7_9STRA|nr:TPA: hypothetical protein N0F65_010235 [Lagenidium giganteum]
MYASPRYNRCSNYSSGSSSTGAYASPTGYSLSKYAQLQQQQYASTTYDDQHAQQYSPPMKGQHAFATRSYGSSSYGEYYPAHQGTTYYDAYGYANTASGSSTASSSQDGYYGEDLMEDFDEYSSCGSPEMTTVPTVPTPLALSKFEHGKTPSGRVLITSGNQTVEFFSCVVNAPLHHPHHRHHAASERLYE